MRLVTTNAALNPSKADHVSNPRFPNRYRGARRAGFGRMVATKQIVQIADTQTEPIHRTDPDAPGSGKSQVPGTVIAVQCRETSIPSCRPGRERTRTNNWTLGRSAQEKSYSVKQGLYTCGLRQIVVSVMTLLLW